jgi:hypothetical protein
MPIGKVYQNEIRFEKLMLVPSYITPMLFGVDLVLIGPKYKLKMIVIWKLNPIRHFVLQLAISLT